MPFSAANDLTLPADKLAQIEKSLGGNPADQTYAKLQDVCDDAAASVARLTLGYVIDSSSLEEFTRSIALYRAFSYIGTVPKDIQDNYKAAWDELQSIAKGERPNIPKVDSSLSGRAGSWGSGQAIPGRMPNQFPNQVAPTPFVPPNTIDGDGDADDNNLGSL